MQDGTPSLSSRPQKVYETKWASFLPLIAEIGKPLRELLSTKRAWLWGSEQERALNELKQELTRLTVLALYNPAARSKISADVSSFGLGAVLK